MRQNIVNHWICLCGHQIYQPCTSKRWNAMHRFSGPVSEDLIAHISMRNPHIFIWTVKLVFGSRKKTRNRAFDEPVSLYRMWIGPLSPSRENVKICNKLRWLAMGWKTDCNSYTKSIYWLSSYERKWIEDFWLSLLQVLSFNTWYSLKS